MQKLIALLSRLDGRGYKAYKSIAGRYDFGDFALCVEHVQGDPFAAPSRLRVCLPARVAGFPPELWENVSRRVGLEHYLAEQFAAQARRFSRRRGTGHSGEIRIDAPGQQMLPRTAVRVGAQGVEARFTVGLPAAGRRILAREAIALLTEDVPAVVRSSLRAAAVDLASARRYALTAEDADFLRSRLASLGLVAFVADGALLPRRSGVDDRPLPNGLPFRSPPSLRTEVHLPNAGVVSGMGVPRGVTLIVGGGFHGKSTLLNALALGIYNHKPDDGRERVVSHPATVKIRAEDGRSVAGVNISGFISNLPLGRGTAFFSTENASGSTSQAAAIMEALELGAQVLLVDEDTAATNFMIRDRRMQALVPKEHEPITPFIDRVRQLYAERGVSTVLVLGGSGDYLDVADTVIGMVEYEPQDLTERARLVAAQFPTGRESEADSPLPLTPRAPEPQSLNPARGKKPVALKARGLDGLTWGREDVDLRALEQIVHPSQVRAIGLAWAYALERGYFDGKRPLRTALELVLREVEERGWEALGRFRDPPGDLAAVRLLEIGAALNRLRSLKVRPAE